MAVDVVEVSARSPGHERRLAADRAESTRRAVDAARDDLVGPHESLVARGKAEVGFGAGGGRCVHGRCRDSLRSHFFCTRGIHFVRNQIFPALGDEYPVDQVFEPVQVGDRLDLGLDGNLRVPEPDPTLANTIVLASSIFPSAFPSAFPSRSIAWYVTDSFIIRTP